MLLRWCVDQIYSDRLDKLPQPEDTVTMEITQQTPGMDVSGTFIAEMDQSDWWRGETEIGDFTRGEIEEYWGSINEGIVFLCEIDEKTANLWPNMRAIFEKCKANPWHPFTKPARKAVKELYDKLLRR